MSTKTIHATLQKDLNLYKKSARWVPILLSDDMKKEQVRTSDEFQKMACHNSISLDHIVAKDESAVSFQTPETKQELKQWLAKGTPRPVKAKVHAKGRSGWCWPSLTPRALSK
jgi:hypothetical protein